MGATNTWQGPEPVYNTTYLVFVLLMFRQDTHYHDVKLVMATESGIKHDNCHITFEAFAASTSTTERVAVTFQTKLYKPLPYPYPRFEIIFVRIKPSDQDQPSEFDSKAQIYQHRLSQVIENYTIVCLLIAFQSISKLFL